MRRAQHPEQHFLRRFDCRRYAFEACAGRYGGQQPERLEFCTDAAPGVDGRQ